LQDVHFRDADQFQSYFTRVNGRMYSGALRETKARRMRRVFLF
jgi:hypothetical protein